MTANHSSVHLDKDIAADGELVRIPTSVYTQTLGERQRE